jgi:hypothetical protein
VSPPPDLEKINRLIAETLGEMIKSGVPMAAVGAFARTYPGVVDRVMGAAAPAPDLDVEKIIQATVVRTMELVVGPPKKPRPPGGWVDSVKVNLVVGGKRTSATISKSLLASIEQLAGSPKAAKALVSQAASEMPKTVKNRSAWLAERLSAHAMADSGREAPPPLH